MRFAILPLLADESRYHPDGILAKSYLYNLYRYRHSYGWRERFSREAAAREGQVVVGNDRKEGTFRRDPVIVTSMVDYLILECVK